MERIKYNDYTTVRKIPFSEIERVDFALCAQPRQTLQNFYNACERKPDILTNGGFFGMSDGSTCFNYVDDGQIVHSTDQYKWGIGIVDAKTMIYNSFDNRTDWRDFISGYPVLIDNYQPVKITFAKELNYKARRTILAFDPDYLYLICIDKPGMAYSAMQAMLQSFNVQYAINLDGGGSTRMMDNGQVVTNGSENRAVDNVVAVYLKKEEERTLYRTQCGAYSQRANAETLLTKIKALGGLYEKAYVRKVNDLWKVQVGCFAIKSNAERVRDDLKSKGFNCFITTK